MRLHIQSQEVGGCTKKIINGLLGRPIPIFILQVFFNVQILNETIYEALGSERPSEMIKICWQHKDVLH